MVNDKPTVNWSKNSIRTTGTSGNIEYSYFKVSMMLQMTHIKQVYQLLTIKNII